ncbi:TrkH family potassium uptake protein [Aerococcus sp. UMB10185]|uniref:TrkH family potassium uptake protein n=1 Tax=unclassified Aerococcus TaxID=2618060 RepID=UPI0008A2A24F|nr:MULTISPECIES: TrkH family potassium uptake protein [unclassified Aerococcus]MDK6232644.1 TrkH family potassium uptake protein [Aerococcus sp. UMB10185]MDK6855066.1 TrkH family potassium uptake protein [Aerococcus sp. UMB7533]OFN02529.1 trk family cation uptake protein [Aerococcus sp. HMSC062A02]OHO45676.1 trk family cation uptake protein [Aerococcus sp. HMSC035B07]
MNTSFLRFIIGRLLMILGLLMIPSILVGLYYGNPARVIWAFVITIALCELLGLALSYRQPDSDIFYQREGFALVSIIWLLYSFFGALPFYLSQSVGDFIDAFFESVSGFTTTGASVLSSSLHILPEALMFWRSFTLLIGGMGMLVFILYILPNFGARGVYVMRAELPGPVFGKVESRVSSSINILYSIYLVMTLVVMVLLRLGKVPWFEAALLAMGASGTGGFNIYSNSIAHYNSDYVDLVMAIAMFIFGMSFNFFYLFYIGKWRQVLRSEELRWYVAIIALASLIIFLNINGLYQSPFQALKDAFFNVVSVNSTTAYTNVSIANWPVTTDIVLLFLMFTGAMSGSTTSGLKIVRIAIFFKSIRQEIRRVLAPSRVHPIKFDGKRVSHDIQRSIAFYLMTYLAVFCLVLFILSHYTQSFSGAFNAVIATLNNIGYSLDLLGPSEDYAELAPFAKFIMCLTMLMGRLEIYPILLSLTPRVWKKY